MKIIPLSQNKIAFVDDADFDYLNQWKWYLSYYGYAVTTWGKRKIYMHRLLMSAPKNMDVDHKDIDPLNNQKYNLRTCEHKFNQANRRKQSNNTSGYKGVVWHKQRSKWYAKIQVSGRQVSLGLFSNIEDAAKAYDEGALKYFGEYAKFNFEKPLC